MTMISKQEAKDQIVKMAKDQGIQGPFKVFHNGSLISTPESLPDQVELGSIQVSAVLDQA